ncbi:DNA-(apurinic or apyrimidinic site) endonuclease [Diorhabda sublineata]|uniref:DNA-(apurinic or apyrimidinic site) endonuclease n=1 Tax=Diorhabda sublineata TaxID=1163346 RepID=UPI0024E0D937|nr:DNA-(apurinic or apyrimidinic site) endonuclease [Diorhabda sublineata]
MILGSLGRSVNVFSVYLKCFRFIRSSKVSYKNSHISSIMPPKRKAAKVEVETESVAEQEPVKSKRGKKAKEVVEANGVDNEITEEGPKRSTRVKKTVANYTEEKEVKEPKPDKPKRVVKKKAAKEEADPKKEEEPIEEPSNEDSSELPEDTKPAKKTKKTSGKEKAIKKTKKAAGEPAEPKTSKRTKKAPVEVEVEENNEEEEKVSEKKTKRGGKTKKTQEKSENGNVEKKPKVLQNKTTTDWKSIDFSCSKKNSYEVPHNLIVSTWNIGGLKSWVNKGCQEYLTHENPDIFCVQETKCSEAKLPDEIKNLNLYKQYWCGSKKEGYAGVGIFTITEPKNVTYGIGDETQDEDARCITAEYDNFYLVNVYVPNSGRKLVTLPKRLEWNDLFVDYIKKLDEKKPVIICGDMNVSHKEIDLARPQNNTKNAGFTPEERKGMTEFLKEGFVDVYRHFYPDEKDVYSFWTYMANARSKNIGWRLDYFVVSERLIKGVCDIKYRTEVLGSDHCPVTLFINV